MRMILKSIALTSLALAMNITALAEPIDSLVWVFLQNKKSPVELSFYLGEYQNPQKECGVGEVGENWTFPLCAGMKLTAFKEELGIYCNHIEPGNAEHFEFGLRLFAAYGAGFSGNWDEHYYPWGKDSKVIHHLMNQLRKPQIQMAVWNFIEPALKHQLISMETKFKGIVVVSFENVQSYFRNYDRKKAYEWYLKDAETSEFASRDYKGNTNPSRKITALIERLMFKWKIIDYKNVMHWTDFIGKWMKQTLGADYDKSRQLWIK